MLRFCVLLRLELSILNERQFHRSRYSCKYLYESGDGWLKIYSMWNAHWLVNVDTHDFLQQM